MGWMILGCSGSSGSGSGSGTSGQQGTVVTGTVEVPDGMLAQAASSTSVFAWLLPEEASAAVACLTPLPLGKLFVFHIDDKGIPVGNALITADLINGAFSFTLPLGIALSADLIVQIAPTTHVGPVPICPVGSPNCDLPGSTLNLPLTQINLTIGPASELLTRQILRSLGSGNVPGRKLTDLSLGDISELHDLMRKTLPRDPRLFTGPTMSMIPALLSAPGSGLQFIIDEYLRSQAPRQLFVLFTERLPQGVVGEPYHAELIAAGGVGQRTWSLSPGAHLPDGLTLDPTGALNGTPLTAGTVVVRLTLAAAGPPASSTERDIPLTILSPVPSVGPGPVRTGQVQTTLPSGPNYAVHYTISCLVGATPIQLLSPSVTIEGSSNVAIGAQGQLLTWDHGGIPVNYAPAVGSLVVNELAGDTLMSIGRWTADGPNSASSGGLLASTFPFPLTCSSQQGFHYAVAKPFTRSVNLPISGIADYMLLAATKPTYNDGHTLPGTMSGGLRVDFTNRKVGLDLHFAMPDQTYDAVSPGGLSDLSQSSTTFDTASDLVTFSFGVPDSLMLGFFVGDSAERVSLGITVFGQPSNTFLVTTGMFGKVGPASTAPPVTSSALGSLILTNVPPGVGGTFVPRMVYPPPLTADLNSHIGEWFGDPVNTYLTVRYSATSCSNQTVEFRSGVPGRPAFITYKLNCATGNCDGLNVNMTNKSVTFAKVSIPSEQGGAPLILDGMLKYP